MRSMEWTREMATDKYRPISKAFRKMLRGSVRKRKPVKDRNQLRGGGVNGGFGPLLAA